VGDSHFKVQDCSPSALVSAFFCHPRAAQPGTRAVWCQAAVLSHSAHCPLQTSQHTTGAPMSLSQTAGETRFGDLAASAEKLPGRTLPTLTQPSESAVLISATLASFLAH
jgi:hypothetical protein